MKRGSQSAINLMVRPTPKKSLGIMVSDGISDTGEEWIETLFRNEINDIDIVDKVMKISNEKRVNSSDDDMTAIMVKLLD